VAGGRKKCKVRESGEVRKFTDSHVRMEAMSLGQAVWIGACQILSACFRNVAVDVHDCGRPTGGMSADRPGIFILLVDTNDGGGHLLRFVEIVRGKGENAIG